MFFRSLHDMGMCTPPHPIFKSCTDPSLKHKGVRSKIRIFFVFFPLHHEAFVTYSGGSINFVEKNPTPDYQWLHPQHIQVESSVFAYITARHHGPVVPHSTGHQWLICAFVLHHRKKFNLKLIQIPFYSFMRYIYPTQCLKISSIYWYAYVSKRYYVMNVRTF